MCFLRFFRKLAPGGIDEAHTKPLYYFRKQMRPDAASGKPAGAFVWKNRFAVTIFQILQSVRHFVRLFAAGRSRAPVFRASSSFYPYGAALRAAPSGAFSSLPPLLPAAISEKPYVLPPPQASVRAGLRYFSAIPTEIRNFGTMR